MNRLEEKYIKLFADTLIYKIKEIEAMPVKRWFNTNMIPKNITGRKYEGMNSVLLLWHTERCNYKYPIFLTFNQAQERNLQIKKGEKAFTVVYSNFVIKDKDNNVITLEEYQELTEEEQKEYRFKSFMKYHNVFNIEQTNLEEENFREWEELTKQTIINNDNFYCENMEVFINSKKWICPIYFRESNRAYYNISNNHIVLPKKEQFYNNKFFYATLLHEMAHSTGYLLNRFDEKTNSILEYGTEELIAEISASLVGLEVGVTFEIMEENVSYIKTWLDNINKDPKYIMPLFSNVVKASNIMIEKIKGE